MATREIGIVGYDQVTALDMFGPLEAFAAANQFLGPRDRRYRMSVVSAGKRRFTAESGVAICAQSSLESAPTFDTIIVPGGQGLREPRITNPIISWVRSRARSTRRLVSICTGAYAFGEAGLLDGRRATTHWRFANDVKQRFPSARFEIDSLFVCDRGIYTSAGIAAGIDLSLSLIEEDFGERVALSTARELVVYLKRPGGQMQFSEPLQFQVKAVDRFADLAAWMIANLKSDLSVERLSARAGLCPRHFSRKFAQELGISPAAYVERLRLDEARRRLPGHGQTVESVAASVGYASVDTFRRAFERQFGTPPSAFRRQFRT